MRRILWFVAAAAIAALPSTGSATSVSLFSPALMSAQTFTCNVLNFNSIQVAATVKLRNNSGVTNSASPNIQPNTSSSVSFSPGSSDTEYCEVDVDSTYVANMRVALTLSSSAGSTSLCSVNGIYPGTATNSAVTTPAVDGTSGTAPDVFQCTVVNTDSSAHNVTIQIIAGDGTVLNSVSSQSIGSNGTYNLAAYPNSNGTAYCTVTASSNMIAKLLRLSHYVFVNGGGANALGAVEGS